MRGLRFILLLLPALACVGVARAADVSREDQFKAAYLFNFVKFIEWPATTPADVLTVCFVGGDGVLQTLATDLDTKRAGSRRLAVKRLQPGSSAAGCNALYVDAAALSDPRTLNSLERSVLTVSDAAEFSKRGGMIELFTDSNRLRFNINVDTANRAGLRISSNLLQLAASVDRESKP